MMRGVVSIEGDGAGLISLEGLRRSRLRARRRNAAHDHDGRVALSC